MAPIPHDFLHPENLAFLERRVLLDRELRLRPELLQPWLRPCAVRVLVVADGLDFMITNGFGLTAFVDTLLDAWGPARFVVTLAHLGSPGPAAMMDSDARIAGRLARFAFDDPAMFAPDRYDVVFLFGIATFFDRLDAAGNRRDAANDRPYPQDGLAETELQALGEFMNGGGGLFATGDHGSLGRYMGRSLPRAGTMRLWDHTVADPIGQEDDDRVSMRGMRRNDTNRRGHDTDSQFDDQSDDIPQEVQPTMYSARNGLFAYSFPHPVLCGPRGVIRIMPDHPHEGECVTPGDTERDIRFTAPLGREYPPATDGGLRPLPEIISVNQVLAGITSGDKDWTLPQRFGGICAYDGHRAGVGRVITDATWHHFVNVNLVGDFGNLDAVKARGFLASPAGQAHLDDIRAYFRNLATWLARPANIACMNRRLLVTLLQTERVMEAVLTTRAVRLEEVSVGTLWLIGRHARDVLGKFASRCQSVRLVLDIVLPEFKPPFPEIDPWRPRLSPGDREERGQEELPIPRGITWINFADTLDVALGAALVAISEDVNPEAPRLEDDRVDERARKGARIGLDMAFGSLRDTLGLVGRALDR